MAFLLHHPLDERAARSPDREAFRFLKQRLTYAELAERSERVAGALIAAGIRRGDRVGIWLNKSLECVLAIYGCFKAGVAFVPLDPGAPVLRLREILAQVEAKALITHQPKAAQAAAVLAAPSPVRCVLGLSEPPEPHVAAVSWEEILAGPAGRCVGPLMEQDLAYIMFTSGSTGAPKGIMHTHASGLAYARLSAATFAVSEDDRLSNHSAMHFDMSTFDYFVPPLTGASATIISEAHAKLPASLAQLIEAERLSIWYSAPFALTQLLLHGGLDQRDMTSLRLVKFGGEPFQPKHLSALMTLWPRARFFNIYGPAEVNHCTHYEVTRDWEAIEPPPIGPMWNNAEGVILDADDNECSCGETGELAVRAPTMMQGYWRRPDLNATCFHDREGPGGELQRFYRTKDLVRDRGDGVLAFLGRKDRQVKVRGFRIELDEIEAVFSSHEDVVEAAVVPVERGGVAELVAAVLMRSGATPAPDALMSHLSARLPAYAVPAAIVFDESFPRTSSGKIDRPELAARLARTPATGD